MIFNKLKLGKFYLSNRVIVSPMCQYSGINGSPSKWHYVHLLKLIKSGAAMVMLESTAVSNNGKITHADLCLNNLKQKKKFKDLLNFLRSHEKQSLIGLQISHSGRKGSSEIPWKKSNTALKNKKKWQTYSASSIKKDKYWPVPKSLSKKEIKIIIKEFINTASLANKTGFDGIEIHMAHGYLIHQFLSPISNKRKDEYGGNLENRCRFALEIAKEVRKTWPKNKILGARITATDHLKNGIGIKDSIYLAKSLNKIGFDYLCISSGGILTKTNLKFYKGFRLKFAEQIKKATKMAIRTSGHLEDLSFAENAIKQKKIDLIAVGRNFVKNTSFLFKYSKKKQIKNFIEKPYLRCI
jgi:2,4-dienoyl-CoA reductase-like NADH-dependent reductase (Old Yellow Enzyme family)